jgi:hypothetical protein
MAQEQEKRQMDAARLEQDDKWEVGAPSWGHVNAACTVTDGALEMTTSALGWCFCSSNEMLARADKKQSIEWTVANFPKTDGPPEMFIGLSKTQDLSNQKNAYELVEFAFSLYGHRGCMWVYEKGKDTSVSLKEFKVGDRLGVSVVGDAVSYEHNGKTVYKSKQKPDFPLFVQAGFSGILGGKVTDLTLTRKDDE